jgi:hypothetical protein
MRRKSGRRNGNGNGRHKKNGNRCSVHGGIIRGRAHYWSGEKMCHNCYSRFTGSGPRGPVKIVRSSSRHSPQKKSWLSRLFGG